MASPKSEQSLQKEEHVMPVSKAGIVSLVREVLDLPGGVQRILLEKDQPVRVWRWVEKNELLEGARTLDVALQESDIIEYDNPDPTKSAPEELFHMLLILENDRHFPVCWATGTDQTKLLRKWLKVDEQGVPFNEKSLLGIPIERLKSLPEDTMLLCGAAHVGGEGGDVTLAVKLALELRGEKDDEAKHEDVVGSGHPAKERSPAARATADSSSWNGESSWNPPSFFRQGFGGGRKIR